MTRGNAALFESCPADTFVFWSPLGNLLNKAEVLDDIKTGALKMDFLKWEDLNIKVNENTAIVTYRSANKGFFRFVDISGEYRWIDVFEKLHGQWKLIFEQGTRIQEAA